MSLRIIFPDLCKTLGSSFMPIPKALNILGLFIYLQLDTNLAIHLIRVTYVLVPSASCDSMLSRSSHGNILAGRSAMSAKWWGKEASKSGIVNIYQTKVAEYIQQDVAILLVTIVPLSVRGSKYPTFST